MSFEIKPSGQACGAEISGLDLSKPLGHTTVADLRSAWLEHHVLSFPGQSLTEDDLERFTLYFGPFGDDPFIAPIPGRANIIAVKREAHETSPIFADAWHTDWSFQKTPPAGTCLYSVETPPVGGDTLFANQHLALDRLPGALRERLDGKLAVHSAKLAYGLAGAYGEADRAGRSMDIRPSDEAHAEQRHPLIRAHPETGRPGLFGCLGYVVGVDGLSETEALPLLSALMPHQTGEAVQYRHRWSPGMLVMWDNRSVLHRATGGYQGHRRLLWRTTIAERA